MIRLILMLLTVGVLDAMIGNNDNYVYCALPAIAGMAIGTALSAGGQMAANAVNNENAKGASARQYEYQQLLNAQGMGLTRDQMRYQQQLTKDFYDYTYDKESYRSQLMQLQDAGLSIGLMYKGNSGVGGQTVQPNANVSGGSAGLAMPEGINGMALMQGMKMDAEIKLLNAQANKLNVDANKTKGVDTQEALARIDKLIADTQNVEIKNILEKYKKASF